MKTETAIGAALAAKGLTARNVEFQIALAKFQNNGGQYGVALAMLNAAYGKGSEGRVVIADGQKVDADTSRTDAAKGLGGSADKAVSLKPNAATERSAGPFNPADKASAEMPVASPRNLPGHAKRGMVAISAVQETVSKSLFDTTILPDGRRLREVRWSECPNLARRYRKLSRIFMAVHSYIVPADPNATLDNIVPDDRLNEIVSAVEKFNDIH